MNNNKLHVLFVLDKINTNSKKISSLGCRLTYKSERKFSQVFLLILITGLVNNKNVKAS